jgi:tripartite-type tricarboxylate transporter receptor subunit TctC
VLATLHSAVAAAMAAPETRDKLSAMGVEAQSGAGEELRALLRRETTVWTQVIKDSGITVQ